MQNLKLYLETAKRSVMIKIFTCKVYRDNQPKPSQRIHFTNRVEIGHSNQTNVELLH
jgi:hypothetical protein